MWPDEAPELAPYHDEPRQLPSGVVGKSAFLRLGFQRRGAKTALVEMDRRAPLMVQQALYWDEAMPGLPCVTIISNAGCIVQGDRNRIEIDVAPAADAHVTTQAATKVHAMDANFATQLQDIVVAENGYLEYMPDQLILHGHARFLMRTRARVHPTATMIYAEILAPGRKYHRDGELFEYDLFSSSLRAERPDGRELFTEKFVVRPWEVSPRQVGVMGSFDYFGNMIVLTPRERAAGIFVQTPAQVNLSEGWAAGASRLPNDAGLSYKVLGMEAQPVRRIMRRFWSLVRQECKGVPVPDEFIWRR
jgi:urease accessory protein